MSALQLKRADGISATSHLDLSATMTLSPSQDSHVQTLSASVITQSSQRELPENVSLVQLLQTMAHALNSPAVAPPNPALLNLDLPATSPLSPSPPFTLQPSSIAIWNSTMVWVTDLLANKLLVAQVEVPSSPTLNVVVLRTSPLFTLPQVKHILPLLVRLLAVLVLAPLDSTAARHPPLNTHPPLPVPRPLSRPPLSRQPPANLPRLL